MKHLIHSTVSMVLVLTLVLSSFITQSLYVKAEEDSAVNLVDSDDAEESELEEQEEENIETNEAEEQGEDDEDVLVQEDENILSDEAEDIDLMMDEDSAELDLLEEEADDGYVGVYQNGKYGVTEIYGSGIIKSAPCYLGGDDTGSYVVFDEGITGIGKNVFEVWGYIEPVRVFLPETLKSLDEGAFISGGGVKMHLHFTGDAPEIDINAFGGYFDVTAFYPDDNDTYEKYVTGEKKVNNVHWMKYCPKTKHKAGPRITWEKKDGVLTFTGYGEMFLYDEASSVYNFPDCIKNLPPWGFISGIREIIFDDRITELGYDIFQSYHSPRTDSPDNPIKIKFPKSLRTIERETLGYFYYETERLPEDLEIIDDPIGDIKCNEEINIEKITYFCDRALEGSRSKISNGINKNCTYIGDHAFYKCVGLIGIVKIPYGMSSRDVAANAFEKTEISEIWLPVTFRNTEAYGPSGLSNGWDYTTVYFYGDKKCGDNLDWRFREDKMIISGTGNMYEYETGEKAPWNQDEDSYGIKKVDVEEGVTSFDAQAFTNIKGIEEIRFIGKQEVKINPIKNGKRGINATIYIPKCWNKKYDNTVFGEDAKIIYYDLDDTPSPVEQKAGEHIRWEIKDKVLYFNGIYEMYDYSCEDDSNRPEWDSQEITTIKFDNDITSIGAGAFKNLKGPIDVYLPSSLKKIGDYAFDEGDFTLKTGIPRSVEEIGKCSCRGLKGENIHLQDVKIIGERAFENNTNIELTAEIDIDYPQIGYKAFYGCTGLNGGFIIMGEVNKEDISPTAFQGTSLEGVVLPISFRDYDKYGEYGVEDAWKPLEIRFVFVDVAKKANQLCYVTEDKLVFYSSVYNIYGESIMPWNDIKYIKGVRKLIVNYAVAIDEYAFINNICITEANLSYVDRIYSHAFSGSEIKHFDLGKELRDVNLSAFEDIDTLETIKFSGEKEVNFIVPNDFKGIKGIIYIPREWNKTYDSAFFGKDAQIVYYNLGEEIIDPIVITKENGRINISEYDVYKLGPNAEPTIESVEYNESGNWKIIDSSNYTSKVTKNNNKYLLTVELNDEFEGSLEQTVTSPKYSLKTAIEKGYIKLPDCSKAATKQDVISKHSKLKNAKYTLNASEDYSVTAIQTRRVTGSTVNVILKGKGNVTDIYTYSINLPPRDLNGNYKVVNGIVYVDGRPLIVCLDYTARRFVYDSKTKSYKEVPLLKFWGYAKGTKMRTEYTGRGMYKGTVTFDYRYGE